MDQTFEPAHSSKRSEKKSSRSTRPTTASALGFDLGAIDDEGQANKLSLADFGDVDLATLDYNLEVLGGGRERKKEKKKTPDEKSKRVKKEKHRDRKPRAVVPQADLSGLASKTRTSEDYLAEWAQHSPEQNVALFERGLQVTQADKGFTITRFTNDLDIWIGLQCTT